MTDHTTNRDNSWEPCPPGDLQRLARGMSRRRTWEHRKQVASTVGAVLAAVASVVLVTVYVRNLRQPMMPGDMNYAGITCTEVRKEMPGMMMGKVDERRIAQIEDHMRQCRPCREFRDQMNMKMSTTPIPTQHEDHSSRRMLAYLEWTIPHRQHR